MQKHLPDTAEPASAPLLEIDGRLPGASSTSLPELLSWTTTNEPPGTTAAPTTAGVTIT